MDRVPRRGKTCFRLTAAQPGGRVTKSAALRSAGDTVPRATAGNGRYPLLVSEL
jgi:hypothetical protein